MNEERRLGAKCLLFVYGMLKPGHSPPRTMTTSWSDAVRGVLFDLGEYPALILEGSELLSRTTSSPSAWIPGMTLEIEVDELPALDDFEDVESGEYVRKTVVTQKGHSVYVYEYARPVPSQCPELPHWPPSRCKP